MKYCYNKKTRSFSLFLLTAAILLMSAFLGCKEKAKNADADSPAETYKIALVMKTLTNPFFVTMEQGARDAEKEFGIELIVKTGAQETSIEQQTAIVEGLIIRKVDAIVIAPAGSVELVPVLKKAVDAGIKVVNIDNKLDEAACERVGLRKVPFISVDNVEGAYLSARYITNQIAAPAEAMIIEGISTAKNSQDRVKGATKAFAEKPGIKLVARASANWKIDEAYDLAKSMFNKHPRVRLLFCANDMMALGAIQYLKEIGRKDVLVASFDNLEEIKPLIE
ncbi:MAG: substrate-binding domain-containing protein, partial [Candidatus Cloacimonetes bacterium]|nr:substrate-binding domain-containing protein [Candidatus Cloacimonadota bacterium]